MILGVPLLLLIAAGAVAGDLIAAIDPAPGIGVISLLGALLAVVLPLPALLSHRRAAALTLISFGYACSTAAGVYSPGFPPDHVARLDLPAKATVAGELIADPELRGTGMRLLLDVENADAGSGPIKASGRILLYVRQGRRAWAAGERLVAPIFLRRPRNFGNPGEFDYRTYLARRGVHVTGFAFDDAAFQPIGGGSIESTSPIRRWRRELHDLFLRVLPGERGGVLCALILGEAGILPRELNDAFGRSGVRHVLTISGLHVSMVAASSYSLFRWLLGRSCWLLLATNVPKIAVAASIIPVLVYAQLAGGGVATMRSVLMALVFLGAVVVDRRRHLLVSLAAAAIILIGVEPGATRDISFQLSFAAVLGLVVVLERFWPWWRRREEDQLMRLQGWRGRVWRSVALYFAVSGAAFAATTPLSAFYFNQVSVMALLSNAVVVPLLGSIAVALGLVAAVLYTVLPALASIVVWIAGAFVAAGIAAVRLFASIPFAAFTVITPTKIEMTLLYAGMAAGLYLSGRRRSVALALIGALTCVDAAWWYSDRRYSDELRLAFLSVGQGDSAVVELPGGEVMVVDGGGLMMSSFDVGERLIAPYLRSRRIRTVDYLVVTHPQWDHYGGFGYLAENFAPRELWSTGGQATAPAYSRLVERMRTSGAVLRVLRQGDRFQLGGVDVVVAAPSANAEGFGINDRSLVLSLAYGSRKVLLTGDIEAPAEGLLVREAADGLHSVVIKVPHHGSASSSTAAFVHAVRPELAVISAGFDNRYGFPSPQVLGRYAAASSRILRTDLDGAIEIRIDAAGDVRVRSWENGVWSTLGSATCREKVLLSELTP